MKISQWVGGALLLLVGYMLGSSHTLDSARAQDGAAAPQAGNQATLPTLTDETRAKIKAAADALTAATDALRLENQYNSATRGINTFSVLTGGNNSLQDLESGAGVDPETFAALYAGLAVNEIAGKLGRDRDGRITYNGRVVRMYPIFRLKQMYAARASITGEEIAAEEPGRGKKKPAAPAESEEEASE